jgi:carbamoyl-phosphate synthase large subunit
MNIQFAVKDERTLCHRGQPARLAHRALRFQGHRRSLAKLAAKVMLGHKLKDLGYTETIIPPHFSVKEAVFPWNRFPGIDIVLGPEMKSTGEVMGIDPDWGMAYAKSQISAFNPLPTEGTVFLSVADRDKDRAVAVARDLVDLGFKIFSTGGTHARLTAEGIPCTRVYKVARTGPPERHRHDEKPRDPLRHQHPSTHESRADEDPHPLHRHRPENLPRHQPLRRRSQRESHALAQGQGTHGEEHPGVSRVIPGMKMAFKPTLMLLPPH